MDLNRKVTPKRKWDFGLRRGVRNATPSQDVGNLQKVKPGRRNLILPKVADEPEDDVCSDTASGDEGNSAKVKPGRRNVILSKVPDESEDDVSSDTVSGDEGNSAKVTTTKTSVKGSSRDVGNKTQPKIPTSEHVDEAAGNTSIKRNLKVGDNTQKDMMVRVSLSKMKPETVAKLKSKGHDGNKISVTEATSTEDQPPPMNIVRSRHDEESVETEAETEIDTEDQTKMKTFEAEIVPKGKNKEEAAPRVVQSEEKVKPKKRKTEPIEEETAVKTSDLNIGGSKSGRRATERSRSLKRGELQESEAFDEIIDQEHSGQERIDLIVTRAKAVKVGKKQSAMKVEKDIAAEGEGLPDRVENIERTADAARTIASYQDSADPELRHAAGTMLMNLKLTRRFMEMKGAVFDYCDN